MEAKIGTTDSKGADLFYFTVVTSRAAHRVDLTERPPPMVVECFSLPDVRERLETILARAVGRDWQEVAECFSKDLAWEFDDYKPLHMTKKRFESFAAFYPFYLAEHANVVSRRLHFIGSTGVIACLVTALVTGNAWWYLGSAICGYGFAWVGHFFFEHNRPATFRHPIYSFIGDWAMYRDVLRGRVKL